MKRPAGCALCRSAKIDMIYDGTIRSGSWGNFTRRKYQVFVCANCGIRFINPKPNVNYAGAEYRNDYNGSSGIEAYFKLHDKEQIQYLELVRHLGLRGKKICDIGCGGGSFLDHIKGLAAMTMGVEPFTGYHRSLKDRGHIVFSDIDALNASGKKCRPDLVTSFHVIEHVDDPIAFLKQIRGIIQPGGRAVLVTPNADDILMKLNFVPYQKFNYRTAHRWYFNDRSLTFAAQKVGFSKIKIEYRHNYDLSNFALWLRDGKPTGNAAVDLFTGDINSAWQKFLENGRMADTIVLGLIK